MTLWSLAGEDLGRVDLIFRDDDGEFCLLVELKLGSAYGDQQLERYRDALDALPARRKALIAVTATAPLAGEDEVASDDRWLGSLRWASIYDELHALPHSDDVVAAVWRSWLAVLRGQGDFGPMDFDRTVIHAWARRDEAEELIRYLLGEVAQPTADIMESLLGGELRVALVYRGQSSVIWPWKNQLHLKYRVPADVTEERLRVQFHAGGGNPYFSVEARYEHPREDLSGLGAVSEATSHLRADGFEVGNDGWGHYWARVIPVDDLLCGPQTIERMLSTISAAGGSLSRSSLFKALAELQPKTPVESPPSEDGAVS